jgi:hypothetical protein
LLALSSLAAAVAACDGSSGPPTGPSLVGPCIHTYQDQVLHIDDAAGTSTGAVIMQLDLSGFAVNGAPRTAIQIVQQSAFNVFAFDNVVRCTLPCSFGTEPGEWEFTASAIGFTPTAQNVAAEYATFSGGCPSFETDGTHVSILLDE